MSIYYSNQIFAAFTWMMFFHVEPVESNFPCTFLNSCGSKEMHFMFVCLDSVRDHGETSIFLVNSTVSFDDHLTGLHMVLNLESKFH